MGIEEQEFLTLLQDKHHKELIGVMTKILEKLENTPPTENLEKILKQIAEKPAADLPGAITAISKVLVKKIDELKQTYKQAPQSNKKEEWVFDVHYDGEEKISHVTVKGK
jgi:hypothetical protein